MNLLSASGNRPGLPLFITALSIPLALFFGLIAVTADPISIGFAAALVLGSAFLVKPDWIIWLILISGLLVTGILPLFIHEGVAARSAWSVSILGFFLMSVAFLKLLSTPAIIKETPAFIWVALIFFIYAIICSLASWHSTGEFFGGVKRYFQMWGFIFALCWLSLDAQKIRRWRIFILCIAIAQLPLAIYQLITWVPFRESIKNAYPHMVPVDVVAGTFGSSITGGGASGEMAVFLIIMLGFLLARRIENLLPAGYFFVLVLTIAAPLFLGETKVVLIMLPLMFAVLYRHRIVKQLRYWLLSFSVVMLITVTAGYTYLNFMPEKSKEELVSDTIAYNFQDKGYGGYYLNRTTAITFWAQNQDAGDPVSFFFGNGLGASHTATRGHIATHYPNYGINLTATPTLLWDLGVFGFLLFITILILAWRCANRLIRESASPVVRADAAAIQAAMAIFAFYLFYRVGILELLSFQIVFTALLGYLAWLHRQHLSSLRKQTV
ncbi:hypothetical protein SAMN05421690_104814 [Nitrosomonas sp. Nm51]|uniref:hypothetical protein n=1 Tax=Nitrosomonas sp. Nm51 TaxID=133720 RepID=UPI0008C2D716|nr:hypothetical protein [Nitrosomonas sp. Nm51]SER65007.1 hypothetical protein SAMN05421690_104814 [Nitrosomonas sp. Nm51]